MVKFFLFSFVVKSFSFPDSLFEKGKEVFENNIKESHLIEYIDSFEIVFEKFFESDSEIWIEGTVYIKKKDLKISKFVSGYSVKDKNIAIKDFIEKAIIYLNSIFREPPVIKEIKDKTVLISKGGIQGIRPNEWFFYGSEISPDGYIKIEKVFDNTSTGKLLVIKRLPAEGEKVYKVKGIPYIHKVSFIPSSHFVRVAKGGFGAEENVKDGTTPLYGAGILYIFRAPLSPFSFGPGFFIYFSDNLDLYKITLLPEYYINKIFSLGASVDILTFWQRERDGRNVRAVNYAITPFFSFTKNFGKWEISLKTGYSLARIMRRFAFEKIGGDTIVLSPDLLFKEVDPKGFNIELFLSFYIKKP